jgi:phosphopentomutase
LGIEKLVDAGAGNGPGDLSMTEKKAAGLLFPNERHPPVFSAVGRMAEASAGKDSVTGHWEMMGIVLDKAFPVFPDGFPSDMMAEVRAANRPRHAGQRGGVRHAESSTTSATNT